MSCLVASSARKTDENNPQVVDAGFSVPREMTMDPEKIKPEEVAAKISSVKYLHEGSLTFCIIEMLSGFKVTGQTVCENASVYDKSKGDKMAYRDAFAKLFLMEKYARRDAAHQRLEKTA